MSSLYRKYRPQTFKDVIGQEKVVSFLSHIAKEKNPSHAYLFSGGRGTGKTSLARIFAKSLGVQEEDILELDAASNRGIEEIKALKETLSFAPFSSPYKVIILDEAHMLTKEASNALLKSLEEPPAHVIFILATTDAHKLLSTISSRCQLVHFEIPALKDLTEAIKKVCKSENVDIEEEAVYKIAELGKGSFRDTLGHLESALIHMHGKPVTLLSLREAYKSPREEDIANIVKGLIDKNEKLIVENILLVKKISSDPHEIFEEVLELLRQLLLLRVDKEVLAGLISKERTTFLIRIESECTNKAQSKLILTLLTHAPLLLLPSRNVWTTLEIILLDAANSQ